MTRKDAERRREPFASLGPLTPPPPPRRPTHSPEKSSTELQLSLSKCKSIKKKSMLEPNGVE